MSRKKEAQQKQEEIQEELRRIRMPKGTECLGIVEQRLGGSRMSVRCLDGKKRNCRIPGRMKRKLWVREGDIIIVEPWEYAADDKGDITFKYRPAQIEYLKQKGYLKSLEDMEEF